MANERKTDFFIGKLLDLAKIKFTPNGSDIKEIQKALKTASKKGTGRAGFPEFVAKSEDFIIVIEDKAETEKQANYQDDENTKLASDVKSIINFAENGALHYANEIIKKTAFKKVFAFGCSGDEKHHIIKPIFVDENGYKLLHLVENFENFSEQNIEKYYNEQILGKTPPEILEAKELQKKAGILHEYLRNYGQLGDKEKPLVVSAILLALHDVNFNIENLIGNERSTDGIKIFTAVENYMREVKVSPEVKRDKVLNQFNIIKDRTLLNQLDERLKNPNKKNELGKTPLRYFTEFIHDNILASIKANVKEDVLGNFYGEFMRYSGGDGQTLGVVLTPNHITELFCDLVEIKKDDNVFDPCCGTAGFLISAMHRMENMTDDEEEKINIKSNQLHGIEIREDMFSIATTNMILRDDGKSNLIPANFLTKKVADLRKNKYTVGFMNPPYSQAKGKDTAHLSEIYFTQHLLDSMADGARCAVIVPQSTMVGKSKEDKKVKKQILEKHTLEGVITLNKETFYRIGTNPCIAVFTAHKPHSDKKYCKFVNFEDDGFEIGKHIGLVETERAKERKAHILNCWLHDAPAESKFMVKTIITDQDEWLHSFYYFNDEIPKEEDFEKTMSDYLSFEFNMIAEGRQYLFEKEEAPKKKVKTKIKLSDREWKAFLFTDIFKIYSSSSGIDKNKLIYKKGDIPYITRSDRNNGIDLFLNKQADKYNTDISNVITIGLDTQTVFYQSNKFYTGQNIQILENEKLNEIVATFLIPLIERQMEKFSWGGNGATLTRLKRSKILLPINLQNEPDYEFMEAYMREKEQGKTEGYKNYISKRVKDLENTKSVVSLLEKEWGEFFIEEVTEIISGKDIYKAERVKGNIPYVSATALNNGIGYFVGNNNKTLEKGCLSVNRNGSVGYSFYHDYPALFSNDCRKLRLKYPSKHVGIFISQQISKQKGKYGYGYKMGTARLKKQKIMLPVTKKHEPDYEFMENYMQGLECEKLKKYLAYKKQK